MSGKGVGENVWETAGMQGVDGCLVLTAGGVGLLW